MRIAQFLPSIAPHDAVSEHTLALARLFAAQSGEESPIFAENIHHKLVGKVRNFQRYDGDADVIVYHHSIGTAVADFVAERPEPLVVGYHNITPAEYFEPYEPHFSAYLNTGRRQLAELSQRTTLAVTESRYNADELRAIGYRHVEIATILLETDRMDVEPSARVRRQLARKAELGGADLLFVGRLSPNKAQHDLVCAFAAFRQTFDPNARLHLIGGCSSQGYVRALHTLITDLGLDDAVFMPDQVSQAELVAYFQGADLFVSASMHEGFCVPVVEAMQSGLPVVARGAAAVPETLGDGGIVYPDDPPLSHAQVAGLWWVVLRDPDLRESLASAGRRRAAEFFSPAVAERHRRLVASVGPGGVFRPVGDPVGGSSEYSLEAGSRR